MLYRKTGDTKWTAQTVSATTASITDLALGSYEFAIQSGCTDIVPDHVQTFEVTDESDDLEDLPIVLADPMQIPVQVSGCTAVTPGELADYYSNFPGTDGTVPSDTTGKLKLPGCALQSSAFSVCSPEHPMVPLPTGGTALTNLKTGDVLGIYDFAVFVTEVSGSESFSGKGLVRLPFMEGTLALAEFSGVRAIRSDDGNGGCVYEATNFRLLNIPQSEVAAAKSKLLSTLAQQTDPAAYAGTLAGALAGYETISDTASLFCTYTAAILQASEEIRKALVDAGGVPSGGDPSGGGNPDPRITDILTGLKTITDQLTAGSPKVDGITQKYQDLISKLDALKKDSQSGEPGSGPGNPVFAIRNVQVSGIDNKSARINWELSGGPTLGGVPSGGTASKYIIEYQDKDGAVLQETVKSPVIDLSRLREGMEYKYRILAYDGDQLLASSDGNFTTIRKTVPMPENLAFTRIDDHSVKITWDKNALHNTYKVVYTDEQGILHTLYPTTNSDTLIGLDPSRFYDYKIVAYNAENLVSDPANARVSTEVPCTLGVSVSSRQSNPSLEENQHVLLVTGCFTPDFKVVDGYPKVTWTNGTPGTIDPNGTITFADGEVAEISTGNFPFIAPDRALIVNPTASKTYTAICKMSATAQPCTYPVNVKVSSADCKGDFKISASVDGQTYQTEDITAQPNAYLNLRAIGCAGQIIWNNALGNQANVKLLVDGNLVVSAQCKEENKTCFSNSISVLGKIEPNSLDIRFVRGKYYGTGEPIEAEVLIKDNFYDLASLPKYWTIDLQANNCSGQVLWTSSNDETFKVDNKQMRFGIEIPLPITTTTYYATCLDKNGVSTPYSRKITLVSNSNQCVRILGPESVPKGNILKLTADGCLGNIKWSRDGEATFATGTTIYDQPIPKDNGSSIIVYNFNTTYRVDCDYPICSGTKVINVFEPTCSINVEQNKLSAKPGDEITLKGTGCGTIIWSLKGNSLAVTSELKIAPSETIKIIASCRGTQCWKEIEIKVPTILPPKIICETLEPHASPSQIYRGESNTINLTANGCEGGTTIWNGPGLPKDSKGQGQNHLVIAQSVTDNAKYTVKCKKDVVDDTEAEIEVKSVLRLDLTATPLSVKKGQKTTLTAIGCSGGTISWVGYNRICQSPCSLENQIINEPTDFKAICTSGTETITKTVTVVLKTDVSGPSGKDYNETFSSACSSFSAYVSPEDTRVIEYPYPSKTKLKLETSGCPTNGKVAWETWDRVAISGNTHSPVETTTYVANCMVGGNACATSYRTIDIAATFDCDNFYVDKQAQGYRRFKFNAEGCPALGELTNTWYLKDGSTKVNQDYFPQASIDPTIAAYEVKCVPDRLKPNTACYFTYSFSDDNEQANFYGRRKYSYPSTPSNGRISAMSEATESAAVIPCQQNFPMQQLMASYFTTLSCTFLENYTGTDGQLSAAEALEFLNKLKQAIAAEPELQKYNLDFSKVSSYVLVEAFEQGKCGAVGSVLGQAAQGNVSTDTYNNDVRPTFTNVAKVFVGKSIVCKSPLVSTSTIIFGAPPIDENSVFALWTEKSTRYTYRLKKGFEITKGINIFTIHSVPNGVSDKWKGAYVAYFNTEAPNDFIGFYKDEQNGSCASTHRRLLFGNCADLCEEGFLPKEYYDMAGPLSLSATATDATCAADDGSINLEATGGVAPYQYSKDGTVFQDNPVFVELKVGTYTITVRDSKSAVATATANIMFVPDLVNVEMSSYQPPVTATNARTDQRSTITVQWGTTGVPYTFTPKTGVTIEYIAGGKVHVTTTDEADKQYNGDYGVYFENNHNIFVGFYKGTNLQKCSPSGYGIDCQPMCKEGFLPQEIYDESFVPYVLAASVHRKGMNDDNTGIHHDMESCDMESDQIIALNALCESELSNQLTETDLINEWKRMASFQSMGKLGNNIMAMIDKFARSEGGEYSNTDLTSAGKNHKSTRRFIDNINTSLAFELTKDPDFVKKQGILKYIVNGEEQQRKDIPSPTWDEKFTGLGIAVNDTWGYDVKIESFTIDKVSRSYQAKISVKIFDHFGLDANDIDPKIKPVFAALSGFRAWFVLQHSKKYCKKPFVTIVNFEESINGTY
ncbi:DUF3289 family protein [Dyadobacter diqingensis]|uniref:DUF3289 family protein n=1 Tax=Dyadobacter diqingensis TaxID=2938121 RepID=UPI0020C18F59|nr:DUF3289 family protein [Dyadobacter diqingensis]